MRRRKLRPNRTPRAQYTVAAQMQVINMATMMETKVTIHQFFDFDASLGTGFVKAVTSALVDASVSDVDSV